MGFALLESLPFVLSCVFFWPLSSLMLITFSFPHLLLLQNYEFFFATLHSALCRFLHSPGGKISSKFTSEESIFESVQGYNQLIAGWGRYIVL